MIDFLTYNEAFKQESVNRQNSEFNELCRYGVSALDDAFLAIAKGEVIVIAASSGYGKTELALHISRTNALNGKKVAHYNLEGGAWEAIQRMKWKDLCDLYYQHHAQAQIELDYRAWLLNKNPDELLVRLETEVFANMQSKIGDNLYLYNNPAGLNCKTFCESLKNLEGLRADMSIDPIIRKGMSGMVNLDLIVIDHLHYFSLEKDENEISEITAILKTIKGLAEDLQIPVILVAHLRKLMRGHGIPDKEDIYGTSNIHKIANTCLIVAPDHEKDDTANGIYPTYIRVAKSRQGLRPNILMNVKFNIKTRSYANEYELYKCFPNGEVAGDPIPWTEIPHWAKNGSVARVRSGETKSEFAW